MERSSNGSAYSKTRSEPSYRKLNRNRWLPPKIPYPTVTYTVTAFPYYCYLSRLKLLRNNPGEDGKLLRNNSYHLYADIQLSFRHAHDLDRTDGWPWSTNASPCCMSHRMGRRDLDFHRTILVSIQLGIFPRIE